MTEYSITLPKQTSVHKPNLKRESARFEGDYMETALIGFDKDGKKGLSEDELLQAFDYFVNKEKEIAIAGRKGDGVITSKDIEQIIKADPKFNKIRETLKDDNAVVDFISNIVMSLCNLVTVDKKYEITRINSRAIEAYMDGDSCIYEFPSNRNVKNTRTNIKKVNGKNVQICQNNKGETFVKSANGKYIYTNPAYVAKCLGYESESTWFGLGADKYYTIENESTHIQVGDGGHHATYEFKQYKEWNEDTHSFTNCEYKATGRSWHCLGGT